MDGKRHWLFIFCAGMYLFSLRALAQESIQLKVGEGDCKGRFQATALANGLNELKPVEAGCGEAGKIIYDRAEKNGVSLEFVGVKYSAKSAPGAINGLALVFDAPDASRVSVSSDVNGFWTEAHYLKNFKKIPRDTQFILWQDRLGKYGAMIPLVGGGMRSVLNGRNNRLEVQASSWMSTFVPDEVPLLAIAQGDDPYQVIAALYEYGLIKMKAQGKLRAQKKYPEIFEYIGWCSWNAHYRQINEEIILEHAESYKQKNFPIGFILIDDGWLTTAPARTHRQSRGKAYLAGFEADKKLFPGGLSQTAAKIKETGVKYVGVWHTFQGYWDGVLTDSELGLREKENLLAYNDKGSIPHPLDGKGEKFFNDWFDFLKRSGIDFVKVDNQSTLRTLVKDQVPIGFAMAGAQDNLQKAAGKYFDYNIINCMEMNIDAVYNYYATNIGRTSNDYIPKLFTNPRAHVHRNIMNALWFSQLSYPDYDMFQTYDLGAEMHAIARAVSGGPVYTTDKAGREKLEILWPLIFSDGKILRPDQPGLPTRDCLFGNPRTQNLPLKAFTRVGDAGVVAAFNVNKSGLPVSGSVSPSDVEGISGQVFAVYEYKSKSLLNLGVNDRDLFMLGVDGAKIWTLKPIRHGFAAIGLADKYVPAKAVISETVDEKKVVLKLYEGGPFLAYSERAPKSILVNGREIPESLVSYSKDRLELNLSGWKGRPVEVLIKF